VLQGLYGAATMAGGSLAIAIVPQLDGIGWRAPCWSALAVALLTAVVLALGPHDARERAHRPRGIAADRRLLRLGLLHGATSGLSVVSANWVVTLLEGHGHDRGVAGALVAGAAAYAVLALPLPLPALGAAMFAAGLVAGLPFAFVFSTAQRLRPDALGAAVGFVNLLAVVAIVVGTPLLGLTFSLPGDGRVGLAAIAVAWLAVLGVLRGLAPGTPRFVDFRSACLTSRPPTRRSPGGRRTSSWPSGCWTRSATGS